MSVITPIVPLSQVASAYRAAAAQPATSGDDFGSMVGRAASAALNTVRTAEATTARGLTGQADVQEVVQALGNADVTMQTVIAVRDKIVSAYNSIIGMSV